jgi:hypothetical protein
MTEPLPKLQRYPYGSLVLIICVAINGFAVGKHPDEMWRWICLAIVIGLSIQSVCGIWGLLSDCGKIINKCADDWKNQADRCQKLAAEIDELRQRVNR